jgi:hypothetical protein
MELLAKTAVEVCWHVFFEHPYKSEIFAIALFDALVTRIVCVRAFRRVCVWIKSFSPYISERLTVVQ